MSVKTTIKNPTKDRQRYPWVPKHGITLEPGESVTIEGPLQAKRKRQTKIMQADIAAGKVSIISEMDTVNPPSDKEIPVDAPAKKEPAKKEEVVKEDSLADENIAVAPVEDVEASMPGVVPVDEDEKEEFYDERGNLLPPEEDPVEVTNIHSIDEDDILAKVALDNEEEEPVEDIEPTIEQILPSKSAMKKMKAGEAKEVAESLGMDIDDDTTKKDAIDFVDALR
jgi:hypothetical protein